MNDQFLTRRNKNSKAKLVSDLNNDCNSAQFRVVGKRIHYLWRNLFLAQVKPFTHTYIFVAFLGTGNKNVHLIALHLL